MSEKGRTFSFLGERGKVFGRLPGTDAMRDSEAGVRKASKEETAGEFAPAAVSVYGDLRRGSERLGRSRTELPAWMGSGIGDFGWGACRGRGAGVLKDLPGS